MYKASDKQASLINIEVEEVYEKYPMLEVIYKDDYPLGFEDAITKKLSQAQADYVIKALQRARGIEKFRGYKLSKALNILMTIK